MISSSKQYWRGGIRIGNSNFDAINISYPFVTFIIYSSTVEFRINFLFKIKKITIEMYDIKMIKKVNGFISNGIQIPPISFSYFYL